LGNSATESRISNIFGSEKVLRSSITAKVITVAAWA